MADALAAMVAKVKQATGTEGDPPLAMRIGQFGQVAVDGHQRLAHFELKGDGITRAYVVTIYKGENGQMFSAEYWRGISDQSIERAYALCLEMAAQEALRE